MRRAVIADTGPLYAAVDPDDSYHQRAHRELQRLARDRYRIIVLYPTLLESYSLVLYRLGTRIASRWLEEILIGSTLANPSPEDYLDAARRIASLPDQSITMFDATTAALATRLSAQVWTYDHHFDVMRSRVWRPS